MQSACQTLLLRMRITPSRIKTLTTCRPRKFSKQADSRQALHSAIPAITPVKTHCFSHLLFAHAQEETLNTRQVTFTPPQIRRHKPYIYIVISISMGKITVHEVAFWNMLVIEPRIHRHNASNLIRRTSTAVYITSRGGATFGTRCQSDEQTAFNLLPSC